MGAGDYLIVGLGNPGDNYRQTRHNIGFLIADELARRWGAAWASEKWQAFSTRISLADWRICLVKPTTYMNLSGRAVRSYADYFKVAADHILVIHDDLDMAPGRLKLVAGGGAGGHNGIRSLVQSLATADFLRLKVGIGRPGKGGVHPDIPVERFVLSPLAEDEKTLLDGRMDILEQGIRALLEGGVAKAMNLINGIK
jgi:PTH1 family peptidyl-tRNA hydrolase